jgi:two-component system response regulator AtoC
MLQRRAFMFDLPGVIVVAGHGALVAGLVGRLAAGGPDKVVSVAQSDAALDSIDAHAAELMLVDCESLGSAAGKLLRAAHERWPDLPLIALSVGADKDEIVTLLGAGASDVISSVAEEELAFALQKARLRARHPAPAPPPAHGVGELVLGRSRAMQAVAKLLEQIAPSSAAVLVRGESGTGKELVARALHRMSPLAQKPFIKIDCASLPDALLESELFGYEKGAFTGAAARKIGRVELAHTGTLMLDEVGELTLPTQAKLLRLLQDRELERLGGTTTLRVEVRVIAATHRDLEAMVARGQFRQDLFYRLNVVPIWLPPLRARRDDIEELARHFCQQAALRNQRPGMALEAGAVRALSAQRWPGNVRQLQNFVERLVVLAPGALITEAQVQGEIERPVQFATETGALGVAAKVSTAPGADTEHLSQIVRDAERQALLKAIEQAAGNRSAAARVLGVSRSTFYAKLREYDLL